MVSKRYDILLLAMGYFILCTVSCTNGFLPEELPYSHFPLNKELRAETVLLDTAEFRFPYRIEIRDNVMLLLDLHNADYFYHAYTYPEGNYIVSFGKRGEGPGETLSPDRIRFHSLDSIWTLDGGKMEIVRWQLYPKERAIEPVQRVRLDKKLIRTLDFFVTDSCFLIQDNTGKNRYTRVTMEGKRISSHGRIPTRRYYKEAYSPGVAQGWQSFVTFSPSKNTFVMASQLGEVVEMYDLNDESFKMMIGPNLYPQFHLVAGDGIPNGIMGFWDVQVTDNYIYTLFEGAGFKELIEASARGERLERGGKYIYVFDFDGNPICKYTLTTPVSGFHVDENAGFITATDLNNDQPIVRFRLE